MASAASGLTLSPFASISSSPVFPVVTLSEGEINETEASVVLRIFREFAAGTGPRTIARTLNEEGVPSPAGRLWSDTTIQGHVRRGKGLACSMRACRQRWRHWKRTSRTEQPADRHARGHADILPSASEIYPKKVAALTKALNRKEERQEATDTLYGLFEKISLAPEHESGEIYTTLHGELSTILGCSERQAIGNWL